MKARFGLLGTEWRKAIAYGRRTRCSKAQPALGMVENLSTLLPALKQYRRSTAVAVLLLSLSVMLRLPTPFLTMYLLDTVIPARRLSLLLYLSGCIIAVSAIVIAAEAGKGIYLLALTRKVQAALQLRLMSHVQRLPTAYFREHDTGYVMSRFVDDVSLVSSSIYDIPLAGVSHVLGFGVGFAALAYINWRLALLSLMIVPAFLVLSLASSQYLRRMTILVQERKAQVSAALHETISSCVTTRLFAREHFQLLQLFRTIRRSIETQLATFIVGTRVSMAASFLGALGPLLVLCYGGNEIIRGRMTVGQLVAFSGVVGQLYGPTQALTGLYISFQATLASLERVAEVLRLEKEPGLMPSTSGCCLESARGDVAFEHVCFAYPNHQCALRDVTFYVPAGSTVAIVGESGAGKSSIVNLMLRLDEPQAGHILIDSIDIKKLDVRALRKLIGVVSPDSYLFSASVLDNIRYGDPAASIADAQHAAQLANAHEFIIKLPRGYDTVIGGLGCQLSAGQRQRVALARAIVKRPAILVLDEATSSIDSQAEEEIWLALKHIVSTHTTLVISHRLSSIGDATIVVLMREGRVVCIGAPDEVRCNQAFNDLFGRQVTDFPKGGRRCSDASLLL